eukprot:TRINITY_DN21159_c0_g1_i1.p1 TRINITY_DN21159_c0_g1~~TRINITY_DN21159_c0_g1_i1.p1  ORF type:complete len:1235 (-),score=261.74 TRINITY_DN21159_c0_g1_i1:250-3954(-)
MRKVLSTGTDFEDLVPVKESGERVRRPSRLLRSVKTVIGTASKLIGTRKKENHDSRRNSIEEEPSSPRTPRGSVQIFSSSVLSIEEAINEVEPTVLYSIVRMCLAIVCSDISFVTAVVQGLTTSEVEAMQALDEKVSHQLAQRCHQGSHPSRGCSPPTQMQLPAARLLQHCQETGIPVNDVLATFLQQGDSCIHSTHWAPDVSHTRTPRGGLDDLGCNGINLEEMPTELPNTTSRILRAGSLDSMASGGSTNLEGYEGEHTLRSPLRNVSPKTTATSSEFFQPPEMRLANDGKPYTWIEFYQHYGPDYAQWNWERATPIVLPPPDAPQKRKDERPTPLEQVQKIVRQGSRGDIFQKSQSLRSGRSAGSSVGPGSKLRTRMSRESLETMRSDISDTSCLGFVENKKSFTFVSPKHAESMKQAAGRAADVVTNMMNPKKMERRDSTCSNLSTYSKGGASTISQTLRSLLWGQAQKSDGEMYNMDGTAQQEEQDETVQQSLALAALHHRRNSGRAMDRTQTMESNGSDATMATGFLIDMATREATGTLTPPIAGGLGAPALDSSFALSQLSGLSFLQNNQSSASPRTSGAGESGCNSSPHASATNVQGLFNSEAAAKSAHEQKHQVPGQNGYSPPVSPRFMEEMQASFHIPANTAKKINEKYEKIRQTRERFRSARSDLEDILEIAGKENGDDKHAEEKTHPNPRRGGNPKQLPSREDSNSGETVDWRNFNFTSDSLPAIVARSTLAEHPRETPSPRNGPPSRQSTASSLKEMQATPTLQDELQRQQSAPPEAGRTPQEPGTSQSLSSLGGQSEPSSMGPSSTGPSLLVPDKNRERCYSFAPPRSDSLMKDVQKEAQLSRIEAWKKRRAEKRRRRRFPTKLTYGVVLRQSHRQTLHTFGSEGEDSDGPDSSQVYSPRSTQELATAKSGTSEVTPSPPNRHPSPTLTATSDDFHMSPSNNRWKSDASEQEEQVRRHWTSPPTSRSGTPVLDPVLSEGEEDEPNQRSVEMDIRITHEDHSGDAVPSGLRPKGLRVSQSRQFDLSQYNTPQWGDMADAATDAAREAADEESSAGAFGKVKRNKLHTWKQQSRKLSVGSNCSLGSAMSSVSGTNLSRQDSIEISPSMPEEYPFMPEVVGQARDKLPGSTGGSDELSIDCQREKQQGGQSCSSRASSFAGVKAGTGATDSPPAERGSETRLEEEKKMAAWRARKAAKAEKKKSGKVTYGALLKREHEQTLDV